MEEALSLVLLAILTLQEVNILMHTCLFRSCPSVWMDSKRFLGCRMIDKYIQIIKFTWLQLGDVDIFKIHYGWLYNSTLIMPFCVMEKVASN